MAIYGAWIWGDYPTKRRVYDHLGIACERPKIDLLYGPRANPMALGPARARPGACACGKRRSLAGARGAIQIGAMESPDWYVDWRDDAFHELERKNARLKSEFRLGTWPRFDYDLDAGTLIFSDAGRPRVVAEIQVAGSTSLKGGDWLWAWGNSHWPAERVADAGLVRAFGEEHGICELVHDSIRDDDLNALGWRLTAVMVRVTDALGAYRPRREEGGGLYLTYKSIAWTS